MYARLCSESRSVVRLVVLVGLSLSLGAATVEAAEPIPERPLLIEEFFANSISYPIGAANEAIRLGPGEVNLRIRWAAAEDDATHGTRYLYRLRGLSDEWIDIGQAREALFIGLGPGEYAFEATSGTSSFLAGAKDPLKVGSPIRIVVKPTLWQRKSLQIGLLATILLALGLFANLRSLVSRRTQERLEQLVDLRTTELAHANRRLLLAATHDDLTGLANRGRVFDQLNLEWRRAIREESCLAVLMIDIDRFKAFNDQYGHLAGDEALSTVADVFQSLLRRSTDLIGRYGGDEFIGVLANTDEEQASSLATSIAEAVRAIGAGQGNGLTLSIGLAALVPTRQMGPPERAIDELVKLADQALYKVKRQGGDAASLSESRLELNGAADAPLALRH